MIGLMNFYVRVSWLKRRKKEVRSLSGFLFSLREFIREGIILWNKLDIPVSKIVESPLEK